MVMKKTKKSATGISNILRAALKRKQSVTSGYSMRALARDLKVSPAFISKVLAGLQPPPKDRLEELCYCLELDILEKEAVVKAVMLDGFSAKVLGKARHLKKSIHERKTNETTDTRFLSSWANIAVLEGLTLTAPYSDLESLRERLDLTITEINHAIEILADAGMIHEIKGRLQKKDEHLYVAGARPRREVRKFHEMMILRARKELLEKFSDEDYQRRLINGFTLAVNPEHVERLKAKIIRFQDELSQEASEGPCTDVYQCNVQFFPLTKKP